MARFLMVKPEKSGQTIKHMMEELSAEVKKLEEEKRELSEQIVRANAEWALLKEALGLGLLKEG